MSFREDADWDNEPESEDWFCSGCRHGQGCNGDDRCTSQEDPEHYEALVARSPDFQQVEGARAAHKVLGRIAL
jgi:hypothetical protein